MSNMSRRSFVKGTALAFGIPTLVPISVIAKENKDDALPNDRINVGQIGCGSISGYHKGHTMRMKDIRVVATCDAYKSRRERRAAEFNKHYGGSNVTTAHADFRELLARKDIDAVIICAHDNWHTPMSIAAAKAGKDIYCQKPMSIDFTMMRHLREEVTKAKSVFQFGTQFRSMGRWRLMVELVRNGHIGKLERIEVWSRNLHHDASKYNVKPYGSTKEIPIPEDLDFDAWQGPSPIVPYTADRCTRWGGFHCPETSLGFLAGCAIHPLGIAQWGNKTDHTSPIRYEGTGNIPNEGIFRTLEHWDMHCEYENGVKLHLMDHQTAKPVITKYCPGKWRDGDGVVFHGTEGWIGNCWNAFYASDNKIWKQECKEKLHDGKEHHRNWIDCVKTRKQTLCHVEMAIRCDTICHMTRAAALTKRPIKFDPKKEEIVGDPEASKLLSLKHRDKWKVW